METIQEILMQASDDQLAILTDYFDATLVGANFKAKLDAIKDRKERIDKMLFTFQGFAKSFFLSTLDYDKIVFKVARRMDIEADETEPLASIEAKIAGRFITDNFTHIPKQQKRELAAALNYGEIKGETTFRLKVDDLILAKTQSPVEMYKVLSWLSAATYESYKTNNGEIWQSKNRICRILRNLFGGSIFRRAMILPVIYISMLRFQYRCHKKK